MASAWGNSWGYSWGNSWGAIESGGAYDDEYYLHKYKDGVYQGDLESELKTLAALEAEVASGKLKSVLRLRSPAKPIESIDGLTIEGHLSEEDEQAIMILLADFMQ